MNPVSIISGRAIPWGAKNIDTDIIIPAHWLKTTSREGMGKGAFESVRAEPGNIFEAPENAGAPILIAGDNFGCGSSREHAAWAILDLGIKAVIAPSYSDIFAGNAFKNGLLGVVLPQDQVDHLIEVSRDGGDVTIDLENQVVTTDRQDRFGFDIDPFRKMCLMAGLDEIGLTMNEDSQITKFETYREAEQPWVIPAAAA